MLTLDRLIGVGVGADGDGRDPVGRAAQFRLQHGGDAGAGDEPGLEIEARREVQKAWVGRA